MLLEAISQRTLSSYEQRADAYRDDTSTRERASDYNLFFAHLAERGPAPYDLLDLGCGPGRDLAYFREQGHRAVGLDGAARFVEMAVQASGCPVLHQDLLALDLPTRGYDGIFASASLFHVPLPALVGVLARLHDALRPGGLLFTLNPRGRDETGWAGDRYCCYLRLSTWQRFMRAGGFVLCASELRPVGVPRRKQQWRSAVWQVCSLR